MKATEILQEDDLAWLIRFKETAEDDNSYDTPKDALKRLIELGAVRSLGFGRCATTAFGDWLVEQHFEQAPSLPLKTEADYSKTPNAEVRGDRPLYGRASLSTDGLCDEGKL